MGRRPVTELFTDEFGENGDIDVILVPDSGPQDLSDREIHQCQILGYLGRKNPGPYDLVTFVEEKKLANPSSPIQGPDPQEFRLMLVEDKRAARTKLLSEVRDQIEKELTIQERARLHKQWIERLKAKAFVRYFL